ncbi:MAG: T9SS type A sorting domain-containing protein [Bacteroidota bacterium]|nr:T9SS type A sorting domain-containing protein [Bacteroidota bacterium]
MGTGIIVTGQGSNLIFSPDGTSPGYNFVTGHGVGEINIRNNGYAYIGQRYQYICRWNCDGVLDFTAVNSSPDAIEPGPCRPIYCWANMAGYNNIYNDYNYFRRLINNETGNTIYAQNTYWGKSSGPNPAQDFYGNVIYIPFLTSPTLSSAPMNPEQPIEEQLAVTYIRAIEENSTNALDALFGLESLRDFGLNLDTYIKMPWENYINKIERKANSVKLKNLASAFKIQEKLGKKDFASTISLSNVYLQNNPDDGMWMYYQVQKIFANIGIGDLNTARTIYDNIKSRAYSIDSISTLAIGEIVSMLSTGNLNLSKSSTSDKLIIEKENSIMPPSFMLHQNYPNPFNPLTIINYHLPFNNYTTLKIYDVLVREIATLVDEYKEAGYYEVNWDAVSVPTGVYLYKLNSGNFVDVKKLILLK